MAENLSQQLKNYDLDELKSLSQKIRQEIIDSVSINLRSSSGTVLTNGDLSTDLSVEIVYGTQVVNNEESELSFYYVWKRNDTALSSLPYIVKRTEEIPDPDEIDEPEIREFYEVESLKIQEGIVPANFFKQKEIHVSVNDFGLKAEYYCIVFDNENDARKEYLLMNENKDTELFNE